MVRLLSAFLYIFYTAGIYVHKNKMAVYTKSPSEKISMSYTEPYEIGDD